MKTGKQTHERAIVPAGYRETSHRETSKRLVRVRASGRGVKVRDRDRSPAAHSDTSEEAAWRSELGRHAARRRRAPEAGGTEMPAPVQSEGRGQGARPGRRNCSLSCSENPDRPTNKQSCDQQPSSSKIDMIIKSYIKLLHSSYPY